MASNAKKEKPGRNDPCPCGSNLKYKKCCEKADKQDKREEMPAGPWLAARQVLLVLAVVEGCCVDTHAAKLPWLAAVLMPVGLALCVYCWLAIKKYRALRPQFPADEPGIDWSEPCSLTKPFFPVAKNPVRFCFLISVMFLSSGAISAARDLFPAAA